MLFIKTKCHYHGESERVSERESKRLCGTLSVSLYFQSCMARGKIATTTTATTTNFYRKTNLLKPANRKTGFSCFCRLCTHRLCTTDTIACLCYCRSTKFYYAVTLATQKFACMYRAVVVVVVLMIFRFATITVIS